MKRNKKVENNSFFIDVILKEIVNSFRGEIGIISIYLYGSALSDRFDPQKSDIDLLMIAEDLKDSLDFVRRIKSISGYFKNIRLDVNIVFLSEFKRRWHIYRPPSYFVGIKHNHRLLFGKDLIRSVRDSEVSMEKVYKRIVDLAQSSRGIYLNTKEPKFWQQKYIKWLRIAVLEILFLIGDFDLSFKTGLNKIKIKYPELGFLDILKNAKLGMEEINGVAEKLRIFMLNHFIKKR